MGLKRYNTGKALVKAERKDDLDALKGVKLADITDPILKKVVKYLQKGS